MSSLDGGSSIDFDIASSGEDYCDLAHTYLCVRAKITKPDGSNLTAAEAVSPVNLFLHALFSQCDIYLNGTLITSSTNTYAYRSIIETILSHGDDSKSTKLAACMYYKDKAGKMDSIEVAGADQNSGFMERRALAAASNTIDMMGRLHADIFFQDRFILPGVSIKIRLNRSKDEFSIMCAPVNPRTVKILSAKLLVRKVKIAPSVALGHARAIEIQSAKYPIRRVVVKSFTVPRGILDVNQEKLISGQIPQRIIIGLVDNEAFIGAYNRNPFNFQNFGLNEIAVYIDGQMNNQIKPLKPDFQHNQYTESYLSIFSAVGKLHSDEGNSIKISEFPAGYCLYGFDLSPDLNEGPFFNLIKTGTVRLAIKLREALDRAISVVVYCEYENVIEVSKNREIIFDFSS